MNKLIIILIFFYFLLAPPAAAAEGDFALVYKDRTFIVPSRTIDTWRGVTRWPKKSIILNQVKPIRIQIMASVGGTVPSYQETAIYPYKPAAIYQSLTQITKSASIAPTEPNLTIEQGRVTDFVPPQDGIVTHLYETTFSVMEALQRNATSTPLVATAMPPKTPLASINSLGFRELIARGESKFHGSPKNRRTNIKVGVEKIKGVIIRPGEEFSFNEHLGPVEKEYGFVPELVIKRTGTVPELGGGLCQVSSTTFRAAMNGGLPITQRKNHSYAVQYYAPQGTDATIYPGVIDLRFLNDTPGAILVWPWFLDDNTLIFDFYGTKDGRTVTLDKPVQYDKKTDGSMKATWRRVVVKDGKETEDVFKSVYLPPALFHREETFVTANTPTSTPVSAPAVQ